MSLMICSLVLPSPEVPAGGQFLLEFLEALPRDHTWLASVKRYVAKEHASYSTAPDGSPLDSVIPPGELAYPWPDGQPRFGISDATLHDVARLLTRDPKAADYFVVNGRFRGCRSEVGPGRPQWRAPGLNLEWPSDAYYWNGAQDQPWGSALYVHWGSRVYYTGQDESAPVFGYLLSAIRALATTPHADHAVGFLAHSFWVQPYCFMVWHRDLLDFASDLLWLLPTVLEEDTCCLDPTIRRAEDPISELVTLTKAAAGPAPDLGRWDDFHGHRPREWLRPRLREEHLACFLGQLDAVAEGIRAVSSDDVVEIGGGCDECSFVQTEPGGCLWAKGGAFSYVEQFYLRLAARVCSGLHMA